MIRKSTAAFAALATAASGLLVASASPASADSTYYACVKKSSGETKMVKKNKKCKKGWKKVSWSGTGPTGATGPAGAPGAPGTALNVKDGTGAVVGLFLGSWSDLVPGFTVLVDGGLWSFQNDGVLYADTNSPYFSDAACTAAVRFVSAVTPEETAKQVARYVPNGPGRITYRANYVGAPTRAWRVSGPNTAAVLDQPLYDLNSAGTCGLEDMVSAGEVAAGATLVSLAEVTPPANRPGPLTVG